MLTLNGVAHGEGVQPSPWVGYGDGFYTADSTVTVSAGTAGEVGSDGAALGYETAVRGYDAAMDQVRPRERPDPEREACWFHLSPPYGHWDGRQLYAEVHGDVNCNFHAKEISYTIQFYANDAACGECTMSGRTVVCTWATHCRGGVAYYNPSGACSGPFTHLGRGYGTYWDSEGVAHTVALNGQDGPAKRGRSYANYC